MDKRMDGRTDKPEPEILIILLLLKLINIKLIKIYT